MHMRNECVTEMIGIQVLKKAGTINTKTHTYTFLIDFPSIKIISIGKWYVRCDGKTYF